MEQRRIASASVVGLVPVRLHRSLDQLERAGAVGIDSDAHLVSVAAMPVDEVHLLGLEAFHEDEQFPAEGGRRHAATRRPVPAPAHVRSPEPMSSAAASNSWRDRIGVAP